MNPQTGEIFHAAGLPLLDSSLGPKQALWLFKVVVARAAVFHRAFWRVIYADDLSPAEAVAEAEMALSAELGGDSGIPDA